MLVFHAALRVAAVIDDRHAEGSEPPRDCAADAAHADHADGTPLQRRLGQRIMSARPLAGAQIAFGLGKFAQRA